MRSLHARESEVILVPISYFCSLFPLEPANEVCSVGVVATYTKVRKNYGIL